MNHSNSSSTKRRLNARGRWLIAIIVAIVAVPVGIYGTNRAITLHKNWEAKQPILVVLDSYGKIHNVYKDGKTLTITGPAKVWSPLNGIGVQEEKWNFAHFQIADEAMQLATQGGSYIVFIQPAGWNSVDHDLKKCLATVQINLR